MNRNLVIVAVVVAALAIAAYVVLGGSSSKKSDATSDGASGATAGTATGTRSDHAASGGSNAGGGTAASSTTPTASGTSDPESPAARFQRARARAMTQLQGDITQRMTECVPRGGGPPRPRPLRLELEWRKEASTPEQQQYMVKQVTMVGGANADAVTPAVQTCIDQIRGMPVVLFTAPDAISDTDRTLDLTFEIPLP